MTRLDEVADEAARVYQLLQTNVDEQIQHSGFVPPATCGMDETPAPTNGTNGANGNGTHGHAPPDGPWRCSDKQKELILKLVDEHSLDRHEVDHLARQRFGKGVRQLNKMETSGLIDELLETHGHGGKAGSRSNGTRCNAYARNGGGR